MKKRNEDALLVDGKVFQGEVRIDLTLSKCEGHIFAVADGMAGSPNPHVGSALLLQLLGKSSAKLSTPTLNLRNRLLDLQYSFVERGKISGCRGAAATLAGIVISGQRAQIFNVGDSRVYYIRDGLIQQVSRDHTELADMIEHGEIESMSIRDAPSSFLEPSSFYMADGMHAVTRVHIQAVALDGSWAILVCTDGLVDVLDDKEIAAGSKDKDSLLALIAEARKRNGTDDITVLVLRPVYSPS
jgi:serine/threonine protein phosphatase PrpC